MIIYAESIDHTFYKEVDLQKHVNFSFIYLHGKLCDLNIFDLCTGTELPEEDGKYKCVVILADGTVCPNCSLYFWHWASKDFPRDATQKGLIVFDNDIKAVKYAEKCLKDKVRQL